MKAPRPPGLLDRLLGTVFFGLWRLVGLLALPWLLLHRRTRPHLWRIPAPVPGWTWLHGASAGEHAAARALVAGMSTGDPALPGPPVWRTKSSLRTPVPGAFPAPLDLPFAVSRWLDRARPGRLVLVEAELWPGWLWHCRRRGIPVTVVHARDSRGTARWRRLGPLWRWLVADVRFVSQAETGDLKAALPPPAPPFSLPPGAFVAASTRAGDEARLLSAWTRLDPATRPLLVLAPRHATRCDAVAATLDQQPLSWRRRSQGVEDLASVDVLLLDSTGELAGLLPGAAAAFVGGTLSEQLGGHSPTEAFAAGLPVVAGPHRRANPAAWQGGRTVDLPDDPSPGALADALRQALALGAVPPRDQAPPADSAVARTLARLPTPVRPPARSARPLLWPAVPVAHALGRTRKAWRGRPQPAGLPVVSVGALAAGGAGKTPAVAWLGQQLTEALGPGSVWVVARGYGRRRGDDVRTALPGSAWTAADLGDELEQHRRRGLPVVSAPDRVAGARAAAAEGARIVLLDDGFQHRRLHRDLDIVCLDADWPGARGPIPVGSRREPWSGLRRAHWLWQSHGVQPIGAELERIPLPHRLRGLALPRVQTRLRPTGWRHRGRLLPLDAVRGEVPVAVGIARPERFLCTLLRLGLSPRLVRRVRDHGDLGDLPAGCVLTEKDAARLPPDADVYALILALEVDGAGPLLDDIHGLVTG